ncbi:hypothetical protein [Donghicola tyrosinivorans]|uniref:N-acetyltransferase domain-containing protein n=1 Tax=Donghicola tyrosinivorans TaxID=1652492 RepID=A0A2T0X5R2_9RHOB|nr:hypothetical protein [Donghicola tyrosinivorans]PRY94225.1 hypothetical protein CLV74_101361 [Donghicola tyrosinivorans]
MTSDLGLRDNAQTASPTLRHGFRFEVLDQSFTDVQGLVELARSAHDESRFSYIPFAPQKVEAIIRRSMEDTKRHGVLLCRDATQLVGMVYCSIGEYHIGAATLLTTIHNMNVRPDVRHKLRGGYAALGLLRGVESWSQARNASEILFHVTSDVELQRTHSFIKKRGYRFIGGSYAKSI